MDFLMISLWLWTLITHCLGTNSQCDITVDADSNHLTEVAFVSFLCCSAILFSFLVTSLLYTLKGNYMRPTL